MTAVDALTENKRGDLPLHGNLSRQIHSKDI